VVTPLWLLTLLGAEDGERRGAQAWIAIAWLGLEIVLPVDWPIDPRIATAINLVPMATTLALVVVAIRAEIGPANARTLSPAVTAS